MWRVISLRIGWLAGDRLLCLPRQLWRDCFDVESTCTLPYALLVSVHFWLPAAIEWRTLTWWMPVIRGINKGIWPKCFPCFCSFLFNQTIFPQRLLWVRLGLPKALKEESLGTDFYRLGALPITQPTLSQHCRTKHSHALEKFAHYT